MPTCWRRARSCSRARPGSCTAIRRSSRPTSADDRRGNHAEQGVTGMNKKLAVLLAALLTAAACGSQAGKPAKSEQGLGQAAPAAAAPDAGAAAPEAQPVTSPAGTPTSIAEAVNQLSGANPSAPSATPKHTVTSGPLARAAASGANGSP